MFVNTEAFFILLVYSLLVGASLGFFYDALMCFADVFFTEKIQKTHPKRILGVNSYEASRALYPYKWQFGAREIFILVLDLVFWLTCAVCVIILLYHLNYGEVRGFSLISAFTGFVVYKYTVGRAVRFILKRLLNIIFSVLKSALIKLSKPIRLAVSKTVIPIVQKGKTNHLRRKTRKYLALMQENEIKLRKIGK